MQRSWVAYSKSFGKCVHLCSLNLTKISNVYITPESSVIPLPTSYLPPTLYFLSSNCCYVLYEPWLSLPILELYVYDVTKVHTLLCKDFTFTWIIF